MGHLDKIFGIIALAFGLLALTLVLSTDAYSHGAQAQARGYNALTHLIVNNGNTLCLNNVRPNAEASASQAVTQ